MNGEWWGRGDSWGGTQKTSLQFPTAPLRILTTVGNEVSSYTHIDERPYWAGEAIKNIIQSIKGYIYVFNLIWVDGLNVQNGAMEARRDMTSTQLSALVSDSMALPFRMSYSLVLVDEDV